MKNFFIASLAAISFSTFAQSYIIMDNGLVLTTDKAGYVYDFGHQAYPRKVGLKGGQYFVEDNHILTTIDHQGLLYRKYEAIPEKVVGRGINYFLSNEGELLTIDSKGVPRNSRDELYKKATHFGGNYFVVSDEYSSILITINADGALTETTPDNFKALDMVAFGGTYFMNNKGVVHTVSRDGAVTTNKDIRVGLIMKKGGNYFSDSNGMLFSVTEMGLLKAPALPLSLKVSSIIKLGSNYFLDINGKLFVVDHEGNVYERTLRNHDFENAVVMSL